VFDSVMMRSIENLIQSILNKTLVLVDNNFFIYFLISVVLFL